MSIRRVSVAKAYAQTLWAHARLRTRADIARHQDRLWRKLTPAIARMPALAHLAGAALEDFPLVEPHAMRAHIADWNSLGLSAEAILAGAEAAERGESGEVRAGVFAGFSTGSAGVRGVFLSSAQERACYLGQSLAKLLPGDVLRRRRIGLCLRADNALYRDVASAGPFAFRFFSLTEDARARAAAIAAFAPDIFIAPAHVLSELARLAEAGAFAPPPFERLYFGAEPMGVGERAWIAARLGARPDPIYQATEGFLGAACKHGALHLNEDSIRFEFEPVGAGRHRPIITDLRRTSQIMARVRLDDLVQLADAPCACGSPLQVVAPIEGRVSDVWRWGDRMIFPRDVEATLEGALGASAQWRACASPSGVRLEADAAHAAPGRAALEALVSGAAPVAIAPLQAQREPKRRRVRWANG